MDGIFRGGAILGNNWAGYLIDRVGIQPMFRLNGYLLVGVAVAAAALLREPPVADETYPRQ